MVFMSKLIKLIFSESFKKLLFFGLLMSLFYLTARIGDPYYGKKEKVNSEKEEIIIADAKQPVFGLIYVAQEMGYFEDESLEVNFREFTTGEEALGSVINKEADLATVFSSPVIKAVFEGKDLSLISTLHTSSENISLLANKSKGIDCVEKLKGKKVAVEKGTSAEYFLHALISESCLNLCEIEVINLPNSEGLELFAQGKIDGVMTWNMPLYRTRKLLAPNETVAINSRSLNEYSILAGTREFVESNPTKIKKLLKALLKAENFTRNNKEETIRILAEKSFGVSESEMTEVWDHFELRLGLDNLFLSSMEREARWHINQGMYEASNLPNLRKIIKIDYLSDLSSDSVTIF